MPQVQPPPFPSPSPSPPLTHPPTVSSQGCPRLSIAPIPLVQAATSLSWSTAPASWRVPKVPCQLVCCLHSGRRNLVYVQHGYVIYSPALLASNPKSGAGQEGSSESGPCRLPQGHSRLLQLLFLPFRLSTCPPPQDAGRSWSLCLDHCPSHCTWLTSLPHSNCISLPPVDL